MSALTIPCPDCPAVYADGFALIVHRRVVHPTQFREWEAEQRAKAKAAMDRPAEAETEEADRRRQTNLPL